MPLSVGMLGVGLTMVVSSCSLSSCSHGDIQSVLAQRERALVIAMNSGVAIEVRR